MEYGSSNRLRGMFGFRDRLSARFSLVGCPRRLTGSLSQAEDLSMPARLADRGLKNVHVVQVPQDEGSFELATQSEKIGGTIIGLGRWVLPSHSLAAMWTSSCWNRKLYLRTLISLMHTSWTPYQYRSQGNDESYKQ